MQFRLDDHKKELFRVAANSNSNNNNNNNNKESPPNVNNIKKKTNFFSKILSNINIGIEFFKQIK